MTVNWSLQHYTDTAANLNARATPILEGSSLLKQTISQLLQNLR